MKKVKFDEVDRDCVIDAVQKRYGVQLDRVPPYRKWLRDESGKNWWVLGGVDDWHGIPKEMMEGEKKRPIEGKLVFAVRKLTHIEVFMGPLRQLVSSIAEASPTGDQYHFNFVVQGTVVRCPQVPAVALQQIDSFPHSDKDRERKQTMNELLKLVKKMSPEELKQLMEELS